jgi:sugar lactone lactonase YvrE
MDYSIISKCSEILGEGTTWDKKNGLLYWVDIKGKLFRRYNLSTGSIETFKTSGMISSLVLSKSGKIYGSMNHGIYEIDEKTGKESLLVETETEYPNNRFNDGKIDPFGNYWVGTMDMNEKSQSGGLYLYTKDKKFTKVLPKFTISNGLTWDLGRMKFYHIDTPTRKVLSYDFNEKNQLSNPKVVVDFRNDVGFPDGMNIDEDGMLWVCHWGGHKVSRWNPVTGTKLDEIVLPATNVTCCVFGGNNFDNLFISTAKLTANQPKDEKDLGGSIFQIKMNIKGRETYYFDDI